MSTIEVALHAFRVDAQAVDQPLRPGQHIVGEDRGVGQDDALDRRVRDVAFVPQRDVFESRLDVRADDAGQAADLFAGDRVALVRHGGRTLLTFGERFFGFPNFGALQVAYFESDFLEETRDERQRRDPRGVAVAGDHLRGDRGGLEGQSCADLLFRIGRDVTEGADRAGKLADAQIVGGGFQALAPAHQLVIPQGEFQAEGDRLGMNTVGAPDLHGVFVFESPAAERCGECARVVQQQTRRFGQHQCLRGIDHVVGSQAVMQPARRVGVSGGRHFFGDSGGEGDDVVLHLAFDGVDSHDVETGVGAECGSGGRGNLTQFGQGVGRGELHGEPLGEAILVGEDAAHLGACVSGDHDRRRIGHE